MTKTMPERIPATHLVAETALNFRCELAGDDLAYIYVNDRYLGNARIVQHGDKRKIKLRNSGSPFGNFVRLRFGDDSTSFRKTNITETDTMRSLLSDPHIVNCLFRTAAHLVLWTPGYADRVEPQPLQPAA